MPLVPDTDGGGVDDGEQVIDNGTIPTDPEDDFMFDDTDGDGLSDYAEINIHETDPDNPDTDDDCWQ